MAASVVLEGNSSKQENNACIHFVDGVSREQVLQAVREHPSMLQSYRRYTHSAQGDKRVMQFSRTPFAPTAGAPQNRPQAAFPPAQAAARPEPARAAAAGASATSTAQPSTGLQGGTAAGATGMDTGEGSPAEEKAVEVAGQQDGGDHEGRWQQPSRRGRNKKASNAPRKPAPASSAPAQQQPVTPSLAEVLAALTAVSLQLTAQLQQNAGPAAASAAPQSTFPSPPTSSARVVPGGNGTA